MKPKRLPRLWCAMQGLLPIAPGVLPISRHAAEGQGPAAADAREVSPNPLESLAKKIPAAEHAMLPAVVARLSKQL